MAQRRFGKVKSSMPMAYAVRKTKHYVADKQILDVYRYLEGTARMGLCVYGMPGSGKSVLASRMYLERRFRGMCFAFVGYNAYTLSEVVLVLLRQIYEFYGMAEQKMEVAYSEQEYVRLFQETIKEIASYELKCILIIDGIEKVQILGRLSVNVILPDELPLNVKMVIITNNKALVCGKKVCFLHHAAVDKYRVLEKMLVVEGKKGELGRIVRSWIFRRKGGIFLEFVYAFVLELLAAAKYDTITKILCQQAFCINALKDLYVAFLKRILGRFPSRKDYIKRFVLYLSYTKNELTEGELEVLLGDVDRDVLAFVYPYLEITGEGRMVIGSEEFQCAIYELWGMKEEQICGFRENIVRVCLKSAEEDPILGREILHQLLYIQDTELLKQILGNLRIVDSITYYNEEYALSQLQKLPNFKEYLYWWSRIKATERNYINIFALVHMEMDWGIFEGAERHLKMLHSLLEQGKIRESFLGNIYKMLLRTFL